MTRLPPPPDPIVAALGCLHRAGWTVGQFAASAEDGGRVWVVSGTNGENLIRVEGATALEAWNFAVEEARRLGMLGRAGDETTG